jgi:hypothetical protein
MLAIPILFYYFYPPSLKVFILIGRASNSQ